MRDFVEYINEQIKRLNIPSSNVFNIDETNIDFNIESGTTLNRKGARTISVQSARSSQRATALLEVSLTGKKLQPYLIFKGLPNSRTGRVLREFSNAAFGYPQNMVYTVQKAAWNDDIRMLEWVERFENQQLKILGKHIL